VVSAPVLELAVQDPAGVRIAREVGAVRVELCSALTLGGLTPSIASIEAAVTAAHDDAARPIGVHVLIRPRAGGFRFDSDELAVMERDVRRAVDAGVDGVVVGCLGAEGELDLESIARLRDAASGATVTVHRAIDLTADPVASLETLVAAGVRRVLTSGGSTRAGEGIEVLRRMVAAAAGRIEVMAGGGVDATSIPALVAAGVDAVHLSAKRSVTESGGIGLGSASPTSVGSYEVTDAAIALDAARALGLRG